MKSDKETVLWFNLEDENKKVLVVEEVREDFPNNNKLIKIIDRKDWLPVNGSRINNTFQLLIINSLSSPASVYSHLQAANQIEALRRIYLGTNNKVYYVKKNSSNSQDYHQVLNLTAQLPPVLQAHLASDFC